MMKLWAAPRTRAIRVAWCLEELDLPYELEGVVFKPTSDAFFVQDTPTGKVPAFSDGDVLMGESGAILQYVLQRYGEGRLHPPVDTPQYADFLHWFHFAESTAFPPLGIVVWLTVYRDDAAAHPHLVEAAIGRSQTAFAQIEQRLSEQEFIVGEFSAADIMLGFTLTAGQLLGCIQPGAFPKTEAYLARIQQRPALQTAIEKIDAAVA